MAEPADRVEDEPEVQDEDAGIEGKPIFKIRPDENVYSYCMFIGPTEEKRKEKKPAHLAGETNWDVVMGYLLVVLNFFMQGVLLYLIFGEIVLTNVGWQNGILKLGGPGANLNFVTEAPTGCNDGGSLCFHEGDTYSCSPPSVQLIGRWDELDTNRDGIWTRAEVEQARDALKCKYYVDPVEVFDVLINMLKERQALLWLHPEVTKGNAIHQPYFTYIMSDVVMCGYRSKDMCANLMERGFFHAPLKYGTSPRVGTSIDSALKYCTALLQPGGMCERNLPSTYAVWKITSATECGESEYTPFKYTNPGNGAQKSLLSVDYSARAEYELAQELWFMVFKAIIIFLWLLQMTVEFKDVLKILTFCGRIPDAADVPEAVIMEQDPSDPEDVRYQIMGITKTHRMTVIVLSLLRVVVTCVLAVVGCAYLVKTNGYADLIMNGVALAFIAEICSVLYDQVLREEVKDQTEDIKPIPVEMYGWAWLNERPALIDMLWVVGITVVVLAIMRWQFTSIVVPVHDALECTCLSTGDHCKEAHTYNYEFWHDYWKDAVPGVFQAVSKLKASTAAASYLSLTSKVTTADDTVLEQQEIDELKERVALLESMRPQSAASLMLPTRDDHSIHRKNRGQATGRSARALRLPG